MTENTVKDMKVYRLYVDGECVQTFGDGPAAESNAFFTLGDWLRAGYSIDRCEVKYEDYVKPDMVKVTARCDFTTDCENFSTALDRFFKEYPDFKKWRRNLERMFKNAIDEMSRTYFDIHADVHSIRNSINNRYHISIIEKSPM